MQGILKGFKELIEEYKRNLLSRYEYIKKMLEDKNFVPEPVDVWKIYDEVWHKNRGVYKYVTQMSGAE